MVKLTLGIIGGGQLGSMLATAAKKLSFSGIITSAEYGATLGETQLINISFITTGAITSAI